MADIFSSSKRSQIMAGIKGKDTEPEKAVRSLLHRMGYRFRIHKKDLPGIPDIVLPSYKKAIFVHGCFWHGHSSCRRASLPTSNILFWRKKIEGNKKRDLLVRRKLKVLGWNSIIVWQCQIKSDPVKIARRLEKFLES